MALPLKGETDSADFLGDSLREIDFKGFDFERWRGEITRSIFEEADFNESRLMLVCTGHPFRWALLDDIAGDLSSSVHSFDVTSPTK